MLIVRADIRLADVAEVPQAEAQEVVQGLSPMAPNPRFRERVRIWCQERRPDATSAGTSEQTAKPSRELGVAIMDEEPYVELLVLEPPHHISPLLPNPPIVWMICGRAEKHLARADMDERDDADHVTNAPNAGQTTCAAARRAGQPEPRRRLR